jgi:hypothetical protein
MISPGWRSRCSADKLVERYRDHLDDAKNSSSAILLRGRENVPFERSDDERY